MIAGSLKLFCGMSSLSRLEFAKRKMRWKLALIRSSVGMKK